MKVLYASLALLLVALFAWGYRSEKQLGTTPAGVAAAEKYWQERIVQVGGRDAYEELARSIASSTSLDQHAAVHTFGSALYREAGLGGIVVCDQRFFGGCFHQFIGTALISEGRTAIPLVVEACTAASFPRSLFCAHGVGHGLVASEGYERADLTVALQECGTFSGVFLTACYQGVFMEYEMRTILGPDSSIASFQSDWYAPCDSLEGIERSSCLFHQSQWWWDLLSQRGISETEVVRTIGELCIGSGSEASVHVCFAGAGNTFGFRKSTEDAFRACTSVSSDPRYVFLCAQSLATREVVGGGSPSWICGHFSSGERQQCETNANDTHVEFEGI